MLRDVPSAALKQLVKLSERKEKLMSQIQEFDREMIRVETKYGIPSKKAGEGAHLTVSHSRENNSHRLSRRGELKANILRVLRGAGTKGMTIRQLSDRLKVPT